MELPELGTVFESKYRLERILGEGGFARVYYAEDTGAGRHVALKVLQPNNGDVYSEDMAARFHREVRIVANLRNPHTVTLFDFGRSADGLLYVVFEYIPGTDLSALLEQRGRLSEAETAHILIQVLRSLREAHQAGLLHRDIKPPNIRIYSYMDDPLRVSVLDFGIARTAQRGSEHSAITQTGALIGTPKYMAPEQLLDGELTPATDLYSVGLIAYEMLTGESAIGGNALSDQLRVLGKEGLSMPITAPVTASMRAIVNKLIAREPAARYASAQAVMQELSDLAAPAMAPRATPLSGPLNHAPSGPLQHPPSLSGPVARPPLTANMSRSAALPARAQEDRLSNAWLVGALVALLLIIAILASVVASVVN